MASQVHLELLVGRRVHDSSGRRLGRIEEVRAQQRGEDWVITEYLLGGGAMLERLSALHLGHAFLRLLGAYSGAPEYAVRWDQMDLSDPEHPKLHCPREELKQIEA